MSKWVKKILSHIWVEQGQPILPNTVEVQNVELAPLAIESDLFILTLAPEWKELPSVDKDQFTFENDRIDLSLVFSTVGANIPAKLTEKAANVLLDSQIEAVDSQFRLKGLYPVSAFEEVTSQSWGHQASFARYYTNEHYYRYFGIVTSAIVLNFTIEGTNISPAIFDAEIEKLFAGLRFMDEIWCGKPIPENTLLH